MFSSLFQMLKRESFKVGLKIDGTHSGSTPRKLKDISAPEIDRLLTLSNYAVKRNIR